MDGKSKPDEVRTTWSAIADEGPASDEGVGLETASEAAKVDCGAVEAAAGA